MSAAEILKTIEEVSPDDTAKLDEIDARVWCYLKVVDYVGLRSVNYLGRQWPHYAGGKTYGRKGEFYACPEPSLNYTRSRDALKVIRPEGWYLTIDDFNIPPMNKGGWVSVLSQGGGKKCFVGRSQSFINKAAVKLGAFAEYKYLPTETLAELHAIIQALEYDRCPK